ncbi:acyltransferase family protein [Shewanella psychrophila]|uniref:Acyltransferase family protein n=1 Tax=Shewanella psychrophila TaxID=225848 RepID=A0A1S6HTH2_9GAMM|nr:acyltransferase [Shewanella psychrophila]AQS38850.1 acyltransferase family protein [Shewanella psychrophila]
MIRELYKKYKFDVKSDRLGPDCLFTHWRLYFSTTMQQLCFKKFKSFSSSSQFRPGAYAITCSKIHIGSNVIIRPHTMIFADPRPGDEGSVVINDDVMLGSGVHIYTGNHRFDMPGVNLIKQGHSEPKTVILKEGCWLGANVIVLPGVTIGKNAVVGAGSLVTKNVADRALVAGNPAKLIKLLA